MKKILMVGICLLISCSVYKPVEDGTIHHFKSIDREKTRYYVSISSRGGLEFYAYFSFVDRAGKYEVGDTVVYMVESEF